MATHLSVVNRVLRRLREDQVTSIIDNDYSELIADFVLDAYDEVVEEYDWQSLYHEVEVAVAIGTTVYDLSTFVAGGGNVADTSTRVCKADSVPEFIDDVISVWIYDDSADDSGYTPILVTPEAMERMKSWDRDADEDDPSYITFYPTEDNTELRMELWPIPTATRQLKARFWTKPDQLTVAAASDSTVLIVPDRPVYQLALMYAYNERGEEIGEPGNLAERRYLESLGAAKEADIKVRERTDRYDWRRD